MEEKDKDPPSGSSTGPAAQAMHGKVAFDTVKSFFGVPDVTGYKLCRNETQYWTPEIVYHDSVTLGQVLFPTDSTQLVAKVLRDGKKKIKKKGQTPRLIDIKSIALKSLKQPREFLPLVPGLVNSLESLEPLEKSEEFVQVRLSPSSKRLSLPVPVTALPDLEIEISFNDETKTTSIQDIRLVNRKENDFLQPQNIVDLRFIREQRVYANLKDDIVDPRIVSFVQRSNFNIWGSERLKTPLGLSLSIPALAIQPHDGFDPTSYDTLLVDYTSLGLEHRSSLTIPYYELDSWPTLTYTNIEAGRIGGRRDELSLHSLRIASDQLSTTDLDPPAVSIDNKTHSEDDHTSILFQKTAALIEKIEQIGQEKSDRPSLQMPEVSRWRSTMRRKIRKVDFTGLRRVNTGPSDNPVLGEKRLQL